MPKPEIDEKPISGWCGLCGEDVVDAKFHFEVDHKINCRPAVNHIADMEYLFKRSPNIFSYETFGGRALFKCNHCVYQSSHQPTMKTHTLGAHQDKLVPGDNPYQWSINKSEAKNKKVVGDNPSNKSKTNSIGKKRGRPLKLVDGNLPNESKSFPSIGKKRGRPSKASMENKKAKLDSNSAEVNTEAKSDDLRLAIENGPSTSAKAFESQNCESHFKTKKSKLERASLDAVLKYEDLEKSGRYRYLPGNLVLAKKKGYPWWPGIISKQPDWDFKFYKVEFFANETETSIDYVLEENIKIYKTCNAFIPKRKVQKTAFEWGEWTKKWTNRRRWNYFVKKFDEQSDSTTDEETEYSNNDDITEIRTWDDVASDERGTWDEVGRDERGTWDEVGRDERGTWDEDASGERGTWDRVASGERGTIVQITFEDEDVHAETDQSGKCDDGASCEPRLYEMDNDITTNCHYYSDIRIEEFDHGSVDRDACIYAASNEESNDEIHDKSSSSIEIVFDARRNKIDKESRRIVVDVEDSSNEIDIEDRSNEDDIEGKRYAVDIEGKRYEVIIEGRRKEVDTEGRSNEVNIEGRSNEVDIAGRNNEVDIEGRSNEVDIAGRSNEVDIEGKSKEVDIDASNAKNVSESSNGKIDCYSGNHEIHQDSINDEMSQHDATNDEKGQVPGKELMENDRIND